jgi:di/tricarboxylate transporter
VTLSLAAQEPPRLRKAPLALASLLLLIAMVVTGFQPIQVASFAAAAFVVLTGAITMEEAYRSIEWRIVFCRGDPPIGSPGANGRRPFPV